MCNLSVLKMNILCFQFNIEGKGGFPGEGGRGGPGNHKDTHASQFRTSAGPCSPPPFFYPLFYLSIYLSFFFFNLFIYLFFFFFYQIRYLPMEEQPEDKYECNRRIFYNPPPPTLTSLPPPPPLPYTHTLF